ncbi:MAG: class I SAM-dependent methyltransferase [Chloroflexi bacterium]|nr:class I SAM-dependent methyltransferase [Chloroflexota bacterium]MBU1750011.1 class I SAM-dependent methyltransferase [Chloroflexota bacterium]
MSSLDYEFLRFIGVLPENQRRIQGFYVPFFAGCQRVVDLACGDGDFVALLGEQGIDALGIDLDESCCAAAQARGIPVRCQDVFDYLRECEPDSLDGIFSAHLMEHLHYQAVAELLQLACAALRPGGRILLVTPNVRSLYAHLDSFYLHFGHVSFYHPELLRFFLLHAGLTDVQTGTNPETAMPLWRDRPPLGVTKGAFVPLDIEFELPARHDTAWRRLTRRCKMYLAQTLVWPYLHQIVPQINAQLTHQMNVRLSELDRQLVQIDGMFRQLDAPVECYALAIKPPVGGAINT